MFRVRESDIQVRLSATAVIVVVTLLLALILSGTAVYQVLEEYRLLGAWLATPGPTSDAHLETLRHDIGVRIIVRSTATTFLLLCTLATLWLQRRQLRLQRTLDRVKRFARDILASVDQGVITTDRRRVISSTNRAATRLLGMDEECVGLPLASVSSDDAPLIGLAQQVAERGDAIRDYDCVISRGGQVRRLRADAHVLKDTAGYTLGCVILLRDVTDRLAIEERVHRMEWFLSLGTLATGLQHEIKNPLTALSIHIQLLEERLLDPASSEPIGDLIGVVKSEVHRLNDVLESFRDFASLQALTPRPTDVVGLLDEVQHLMAPQAKQQRIEIVLRVPNEPPPVVALDREKFKQSVLNLVINALEAMSGGGTLTLGVVSHPAEVIVEVSDTGPGIPPEIQGDLFKPYFSTKCRGTGMGLALTQKLIGQHGGRVEFQTSPAGTTFCLAVPIAPAAVSCDQA
jgi:two-component system, NtrC family, sensor histidine kinase HydH